MMLYYLILLFVLMIFKILNVLIDIIVELMNIHETKCKYLNQVISGTSRDNLMRFSAISSVHQCLLFYKIKTLSYYL